MKKRLIDANALIEILTRCIDQTRGAMRSMFMVIKHMVNQMPTVDAVEVVEYIELREQYDKIFTEFHELRDAFVDYVCGGIPNPSPFCKNKYPGCCDSYGWCKNDDKCKGFNPAKIFMDGGRKDNEHTI